jgi:hypothetical protein
MFIVLCTQILIMKEARSNVGKKKNGVSAQCTFYEFELQI